MPTYADNPPRSQTIPTTERAPLGREDLLSARLAGGAGILARKSLGQMHGAEAFGYILPMQLQRRVDLRAQDRHQALREHGRAPEHCTNLVACQDHRQSRGAPCSRDPVEPGQFDVQYLTIQMQYGRKRLIPGGRRRAPLDRERGQECLGFRTAEFDRVMLAMKKHVASNPEDVGVLGARRIVQRAQPITNLVE